MKPIKHALLIICFWGSISVIFSQWDKYPIYGDYENMMNQFAIDHEALCEIVEFGESVRGRKLLAAKISDNIDSVEKEPKFLYVSSIHGNEAGSYVLMLRLIDYLLSNYGSDTLVTKLINNMEIWINPLANPDGTYRAGDGSIAGAARFNANGIDLSRNFPLPPSGDSTVLEMETKAFIELGEAEHFVMGGDLHSSMELAKYPWSFSLSNRKPADNDWWIYVGHVYADEAQANGPSGYFDDFGGVVCSDTFMTNTGHRMDYATYFQKCRTITLELSSEKIIVELNDYWDYNYKSFLLYIEQTLFGIQGTVTDSFTGEPLHAKVFVENHDRDSSHVYSHVPYGDYYRPIFEGTYTVTYSADGYIPKTISGIGVQNNNATVVDVKLSNSTGILNSPGKKIDKISVKNHKNQIIFQFGVKTDAGVSASIFDVSGRLIKRLDTGAGVGKGKFVWNGLDNNGNPVSKGCYFLHVTCADDSIVKRFMVLR